MKITSSERKNLLRCHNELKATLQTIIECDDIWMSDIAKLKELMFTLRHTFNFEPSYDDEGNVLHYSDYVMADISEEEQN